MKCTPLPQDAQQQLKTAKDEASGKDQEFHKELSTARKLAQLYKEAEAERCRKVAELEGIVMELQKHLTVSPLCSRSSWYCCCATQEESQSLADTIERLL